MSLFFMFQISYWMKIYELEASIRKQFQENSSIGKSSAALMTSQFNAGLTLGGPLHNINSNSSVSQDSKQQTKTRISL